MSMECQHKVLHEVFLQKSENRLSSAHQTTKASEVDTTNFKQAENTQHKVVVQSVEQSATKAGIITLYQVCLVMQKVKMMSKRFLMH